MDRRNIPPSDLANRQAPIPSQVPPSSNRAGNVGRQADVVQNSKTRRIADQADAERRMGLREATAALTKIPGLSDLPPQLPTARVVPNRLRMVNRSLVIPVATGADGLVVIPQNPYRRRFILQDVNLSGNIRFSYAKNTLTGTQQIPVTQWDENGVGVSIDDIVIYTLANNLTIVAYEGVDNDSAVPV